MIQAESNAFWGADIHSPDVNGNQPQAGPHFGPKIENEQYSETATCREIGDSVHVGSPKAAGYNW
jgi:hypothetical protein